MFFSFFLISIFSLLTRQRQLPDIPMTQQAASPMQNSVFRHLITAGKVKANGPSESPDRGDSYSDGHGDIGNWGWEFESQVSSRFVYPAASLEFTNVLLPPGRYVRRFSHTRCREHSEEEALARERRSGS